MSSARGIACFISMLGFAGSAGSLTPQAAGGPARDYRFIAGMSGLALVAAPPELRTVREARLLDDSPALDAGVQAGDEIESVDGVRASEIGLPELRERFRREGREIRLDLRRGMERISITLRLRRMI